MSIILGIDPGVRVTGYGVLKIDGRQIHYIDSGCIRTIPGDEALRLKQIHDGVVQVIEEHQPDQGAIEQIFSFYNVGGALKLGQARGVAMVCMANYGLPVAEYSAKQVKQAVVGYGGADKHQMKQMVTTLLSLPKVPAADAADALAIALCHHHSNSILSQVGATKLVRGRLQ